MCHRTSLPHPAVARLGAGLIIPPTDQSPETIGAAVETLLAERSYLDAADQVARDIEALPDVAAVAGELLRRARRS